MMNVHHQLPTSSSYDEVVATSSSANNFLHHHHHHQHTTTSTEYFYEQQILNTLNSNHHGDLGGNGYDGNSQQQLPPISGTFMGFSTTSSSNHHCSSEAGVLDATAAGISMTPGMNAIESAAKPFYIKEEEETEGAAGLLCDEIGTFYCSKENIDGIEAAAAASAASCENASLKASTSTPGIQSGIYQACFCCTETINDKWLIFVNNTHWHVSCLKCSSCSHQLNDLPTCFWRENRIFCKACYQTQFIEAKCAACQRPIASKDWVRRAREFVYHLACFACSHCKRQLSTGEEFSLTDNRLLCKQHYLELIHGQCKAKTKRVRTTFAEEQLSVLQTHFQIDSNPDGADLEKIANITGLSKRVTQVWFQNSRARQKKYQGSKKSRGGSDRCGSATNISGRSSSASMSVTGSPGCDGMMFPTSVTTSSDDIEKPMDSIMFSE